VRKLWPWLLVIVVVIAGLVALLTGPQWLQVATWWLCAIGIAAASAWGTRRLRARVSTTKPRAFADAAAAEEVADLEVFARAETADVDAAYAERRAELRALASEQATEALRDAGSGAAPPRPWLGPS